MSKAPAYVMTPYEKAAQAANDELLQIITADPRAARELNRVLNWTDCEIESTFLGFAHVYAAARLVAPPHFTILDVGC